MAQEFLQFCYFLIDHTSFQIFCEFESFDQIDLNSLQLSKLFLKRFNLIL